VEVEVVVNVKQNERGEVVLPVLEEGGEHDKCPTNRTEQSRSTKAEQRKKKKLFAVRFDSAADLANLGQNVPCPWTRTPQKVGLERVCRCGVWCVGANKREREKKKKKKKKVPLYQSAFHGRFSCIFFVARRALNTFSLFAKANQSKPCKVGRIASDATAA